MPGYIFHKALQQAHVVDDEHKFSVQKIGGAAAKLHPLEVNFKIIHHRTEIRVDDDIQNDLVRGFIDVDDRFFRREVHPVVNVQISHAHARDIGAHAALVHVCLVRDDERGSQIADGQALALVVISDRHHDLRRLFVLHAHAGEDLISQQRPALRVVGAVDAVADIVQIPRDAHEFHAALFGADLLQYIPRPFADDARMADGMLGKAQRLDLALRDGHDDFYFLVVFNVRYRNQKT